MHAVCNIENISVPLCGTKVQRMEKKKTKYPAMWKRLFLANKQGALLGCSAGSIASYVTGAAALLSNLEIESEIVVFK